MKQTVSKVIVGAFLLLFLLSMILGICSCSVTINLDCKQPVKKDTVVVIKKCDGCTFKQGINIDPGFQEIPNWGYPDLDSVFLRNNTNLNAIKIGGKYR